jgi:DNA-directed RNA polymerase specialized sigma24 family protein
MAFDTEGTNMEQDGDVGISDKMDRMLRLVGMIAVNGLSQTEQIATLSRCGFSPREIADIVGTTANTVRVALVSIRRAGRLKKRRTSSSQQESANAKA